MTLTRETSSKLEKVHAVSVGIHSARNLHMTNLCGEADVLGSVCACRCRSESAGLLPGSSQPKVPDSGDAALIGVEPVSEADIRQLNEN